MQDGEVVWVTYRHLVQAGTRSITINASVRPLAQMPGWAQTKIMKKAFTAIIAMTIIGASNAQTCIKVVSDTTVQRVITPVKKCSGWWLFKKCVTVYDTAYATTITKDTIIVTCESPVKPSASGIAIRQYNWVDNVNNPDKNFYNDSIINVVVIRPYLKDISKGEGVYDFTAIDTCMKLNAATGVKYKIRIVNGFPQWMKEKFGSYVVPTGGYTDKGWNDGDSISVKWWQDDYLTAYAKIMQAVADRYDNDERVLDIVASATTFATGEPFDIAIGNTGDHLLRKQAIIAAGCTDQIRIAAIKKSFDLMACFKRTNISCAFNSYHPVAVKGIEQNDTTYMLIDYFCSLFGNRAVVGNNGLRPAYTDKDWNTGGKQYRLCEYFKVAQLKYGCNIYFQTASVEQMGGEQNIEATFDNGVYWGATFIEAPGTEKKLKGQITVDLLRNYNGLLKRN